MPSPPASVNSQPKPADSSQPAQSTTTSATQAEANLNRGLHSTYLHRNPISGRPSPTVGSTGLGESGGARPAGTNSASSSGGPGNGLRPSYVPFGSRESTSVPETAKYTIDSRGMRVADPKPPTPSTASPTMSHSHVGGPHHHHHHHHHHPHTAATPTAASTTPSTAPATSTATAATASTTVPKRETQSYSYGFRSVFPSAMVSEQEARDYGTHRLRERERQMARLDQERKEREAKANAATSPRASTATPGNPYPRPSLPPSPTNSRALPAAASASPALSNKASPALPSTATASGSSQRPNLPLPSLSSIGGRSLPSPFDAQGRERPPSAAGQQPGAIHRRTPSGGTGTRPDTAALGPGQLSPGKPPAAQPTSARPIFGSPAFGAGGGNRDVKPLTNPAQPQQPLPASREPPRPTSTAPKPNPTATSSTARPPGRDFPGGGNYPGYGGFMPFSGGFDYNGFGGWGGNRSRPSEREQKEYADEKKRLADEQEARMVRIRAATAQREKEVREAREQQEKERLQRDQLQRERIKAAGQREQLDRDQLRRYLDVQPGQPSAQNPNDALQQVAPRREPRPYEYKTDSRDYQYTPRDKRPRMDAAVDDARRGNVNKSKRRKDDDRQKSPVRIRDFAHLTETTRKYPEVKSTAVEAWLKTKSDMDRVVAQETYSGSDYRLSHHQDRNKQGGIVKVHIGGGFLGKNWTLRGALGWEEASSTPIRSEGRPGRGDGQICAAWDKRGVWGTDVYTDDSDLGLVLVHAGWIKWGGQPSNDTDSLVVDVRIVPALIHYTATERCGVLTRNWGNGHDGSSIVIEAVRRIPGNKTQLAGRKNRKLRMAEYARERDHVFDIDQTSTVQPRHPDEPRVPLAELIKSVNVQSAIAEPFLLASRDGVAMRYTPRAVEDCLELNDDGDKEGGESNKALNTLWIKDLEFHHGSSSYRLSVLESGPAPLLRLVHTPLRLYPSTAPDDADKAKGKTTVVFDRLPSTNLHWVPEGIVYVPPESDSVKKAKELVEAKLCRITGYRWIKSLVIEPETGADEGMQVD